MINGHHSPQKWHYNSFDGIRENDVCGRTTTNDDRPRYNSIVLLYSNTT